MANLMCKVFGHKSSDKIVVHKCKALPIVFIHFRCERCGKTIYPFVNWKYVKGKWKASQCWMEREDE